MATHSGNVTIGTDTETARLSVSGQVNQMTLYLDDASYGNMIIKHQSGQILDFCNGNMSQVFGTNGVEKMRIVHTTGKVGIGTSSPDASLEVRGGSSPSEFRVGGNIAHVAKMIVETNTHYQDLEIIISRYGYSFEQIKHINYGGTSGGSPGGLHFRSNNGNDPHHFSVYQDKMYIGGDSNTPTFTYNLEVEGTFYSSGSSMDYKQEVQDYKPDTDAIMNLRPVHYEYKNKWKKFGKRLANNNGQIGLVAEEVAEVMPELAVMKEEDGKDVVRNVDYEKLTVVLLSEIQELKREVKALKEEN